MSTEDSALEKLLAVVKGFQETAESQQTFIRDYITQLEATRKRDRLWSNVRTIALSLAMFAGPIVLLTYASVAGPRGSFSDSYAALVRVEGVIDRNAHANASSVVNAMERAFADKKAKGVVVLVNSPGGSPVQSSVIRERLKALRAAHPATKVWVVGEDMMTSGGYFIATGGDHICVNRSTVVGSIGVIQDGWGLDKLIARYDIERRVFTAGKNKSRLDMFQPMSQADHTKVETLLATVHTHFKDVVREGRGERLKGSEETLFSGDFWSGEEAVALGLVDGLCDLPSLLAREFGVHDAKDFTPAPSLLGGLARTVGAEVSTQLWSAVRPQLLPR